MEIAYFKHNDFIKIELSDVLVYDQLIDFITLLGKEKSDKILIDGTKMTNTDLSYKQRYDIGILAVSKLKKNVKIVVVWQERDINYFAISVMKLEGINIQACAKENKATKWLLK